MFVAFLLWQVHWFWRNKFHSQTVLGEMFGTFRDSEVWNITHQESHISHHILHMNLLVLLNIIDTNSVALIQFI